MGELMSFAWLLAWAVAGGWWWGRSSAMKKIAAAAKGTKVGKCRFCGVLIEGGGLDMEAHERFYCRPPKKADQ